MPIAFVVEDGTGKSDATSYVSVAEADDIAALNIHTSTAWNALTVGQKQNLLIYVTKALDARTRWRGEKTTLTQALEWPRKDVVDRFGNKLADNAVPFNVRMAVVEFAKWTAGSDKVSVDRPDSVVSEVKADAVTVKFANAADIAKAQYDLPELIIDLLKGYGSTRDRPGSVAFGRVTRR